MPSQPHPPLGLLFLRITSDLVPLASHPANHFPWDEDFAADFAGIGALMRAFGMRISMHPGQYTLLNSPRAEVLRAAVADLLYHARVLELLGLDQTAKIQIHVGGVYGDKKQAMERFVRAVEGLPPEVRARLVLENDERFFTFSDVLALHRRTGVPLVFDFFHHELNPDGRSLPEALEAQGATWKPGDGLPVGRRGGHARALDEGHFLRFLEGSRPHDFDLMLEVKDKERSALRALKLAQGDRRVVLHVQAERG